MSTCCQDPTKPPNKVDARELARAEMRYDELVRDSSVGTMAMLSFRRSNATEES